MEKEIQEALDPEFGQNEIILLKKDLHRMELRLDELRKRQEQTIQEMERAVYKRETIQLKYTKNDDVSEKGKGKENKTQIERQIQSLKGTLTQTTKNNKEYDKKLMQLQNQMNEVETFNIAKRFIINRDIITLHRLRQPPRDKKQTSQKT